MMWIKKTAAQDLWLYFYAKKTYPFRVVTYLHSAFKVGVYIYKTNRCVESVSF